MTVRGRGHVVGKTSCEECGSSDNRAVYSNEDGSITSYCFTPGCGKAKQHEIMPELVTESKITSGRDVEGDQARIDEIGRLPSVHLHDRKIPKEVTEKYGVKSVINEKGKEIARYYPVMRKGQITGYKRRILPKTFSQLGDAKRPLDMFGQHLFKDGHTLIITEGEEDALAAHTMTMEHSRTNRGYPAVSVGSAGDIVNAVRENLQYISRFKSVVFAVDQEEMALKKAEEAGKLLEPGQAVVLRMPEKDASDMLTKGRSDAFWTALFNTQEVEVGGIVEGSDAIWATWLERKNYECIEYPAEWGLDFCPGFYAPSLVTVTAGCVSADTEYLTRSGWKRFDEMEEGDAPAQYHGDGTISFCKDAKFVKYPETHLTYIKGTYGIRQKLSDEHRVVYFEEGRKTQQIKPLHQIKDRVLSGTFRGLIRTSATLRETTRSRYTDDELRLIVAVAADGHMPHKNNRCYVNLKKKDKKERLEKLLESACVDYTIHKGAPGYSRYYFKHIRDSKHLPGWLPYLSPDQLEIVAEELFLWDGTKATKSFYSRSKHDADTAQLVLTFSGRSATLGAHLREDGSTDYKVMACGRVYRSMRRCPAEVIETSDGYKYCAQVDTGMLLLRCEGRVFVTGNTGVGKSSVLKHMQYYLWERTRYGVGVISMEEPIGLCSGILAGMAIKKRITVPDNEATEEEIKGAYDKVFGDGRMVYCDNTGIRSDQDLLGVIRFMANSRQCRFIFVDHLTALVNKLGSNGKNDYTEKLVNSLNDLCIELNVCIILVSHVRKTPSGSEKTYESGLVPTEDAMFGSSAIKQYSHQTIAISRDKTENGGPMFLHVLKDRLSGQTGKSVPLFYNMKTGWYETSPGVINNTQDSEDDIL